MDERRRRIKKLADVAVALIQAGLDEVQTMDWIENLAVTLWAPSHNTLNDYVDAAMDEAMVILGAAQKNLYTWAPRYSDPGETEP